jgi:uncharacterized MAPEG superfamily protein
MTPRAGEGNCNVGVTLLYNHKTYPIDICSLMTISVPTDFASVLLYAIALAMLLVYIPFFWVGYARARLGYDYSAPRAMFDKLPPYAKRATWAHQNGFESFPLFAAAALIVYVTERSSMVTAALAAIYLVARLLFSLFYILDWPRWRSLGWALSNAGTVGLLLIGLGVLSF